MPPVDSPQRPMAGTEAGQWAFEQQQQQEQDRNHQLAAASPDNGPTRGHGPQPLSTRSVAKKFGTSHSSVHRQLKALREGNPGARSPVRRGRPSKLTDIEEQMLVFHLSMRLKEGLPVSRKTVRIASNELLSRRTPPGKPACDTWVKRWWQTTKRRLLAESQAAANAEAQSPIPGVVALEDDQAGSNSDSEAEDQVPGVQSSNVTANPDADQTSGTPSSSVAPPTRTTSNPPEPVLMLLPGSRKEGESEIKGSSQNGDGDGDGDGGGHWKYTNSTLALAPK